MWFSSWMWKQISTRPPRGRTAHRLAAARFRPRLETLEDRLAPAQVSLTVSSLADSGPGTLRAAILTADAGSHSDQFTIGFGVAGTIDLLSPLPDLNNAVTVQGPGASSLTIQRDSTVPFASAILTVDAGQTASLSGLTIANGDAAFGAGIVNDGTLVVSDCILSGNSATEGGGIFNGGTMTVSKCTLSHNSSTLQGGGIANGGMLTVSGSTLSSNSTNGGGGGIVNDNGAAALTVSGCTLSDNTAHSGGGVNNFGTLTVSGSTLSDNHASFGGGINSDGPLNIANSTLSDNSAVADGGGIRCETRPFFGTATVSHCLLSGNTAGSNGGGINSVGGGGLLTVRDSTFTGNTATEGGAIYNDALGTLAVHGSTFSGNTASDSGGGLYNLGTAALQESTLSGNSAGSGGGGIFNAASGALTIDDSSVEHNSAPVGADLDNLGSVTLNDSTVGVIGP
jgi:predicted outer membrane repeat protein